MKELSVYYCPTCGYYAYFQLSKNATCPTDHTRLVGLDMRYQDFMNLDYEERDRLLIGKITQSAPSLIRRICTSEKLYNQRALVGELTAEYAKLQKENEELNHTVSWMHQLVWEQIRRNKVLEQKMEVLKHD